MSQNFADLGQKLNLVGGGAGSGNLINGTYQPGATFYADAAQQLDVALVLTFDAATVLTDIRVKLQGRHASWPAGVWQDIPTTKGSTQASPPVAEQVFTASAGATIVDSLQCLSGQHKFYSGGFQIVAKATAAATKPGDTVAGEIMAW